MLNWFKNFIFKKQKIQTFDKEQIFIITYIADGDLTQEYTWQCISHNEDTARYDFWDEHNELYHDILSVNIV